MTLNHYTITVKLANKPDSPGTKLTKLAIETPAGDLGWIEPFIQDEMALQCGPATYVVKRGTAIVKRGSIDLGERLPVDQHKPGCQCLPCFEREYAAHPADCPCMVCQDIRNAPGAKAAEAAEQASPLPLRTDPRTMPAGRLVPFGTDDDGEAIVLPPIDEREITDYITDEADAEAARRFPDPVVKQPRKTNADRLLAALIDGSHKCGHDLRVETGIKSYAALGRAAAALRKKGYNVRKIRWNAPSSDMYHIIDATPELREERLAWEREQRAKRDAEYAEAERDMPWNNDGVSTKTAQMILARNRKRAGAPKADSGRNRSCRTGRAGRLLHGSGWTRLARPCPSPSGTRKPTTAIRPWQPPSRAPARTSVSLSRITGRRSGPRPPRASRSSTMTRSAGGRPSARPPSTQP